MLSNTLRRNFCYLKAFHIFHPRYHPQIIGHIQKNKQKNKYVCIDKITQLIIRKAKIKMKKQSYRYKENRPRARLDTNIVTNIRRVSV